MSELEILKSLVRQLLNDLPQKRDWLDPTVEQALRYHVKAETPAANHRALLHTWGQQDQELCRKPRFKDRTKNA